MTNFVINKVIRLSGKTIFFLRVILGILLVIFILLMGNMPKNNDYLGTVYTILLNASVIFGILYFWIGLKFDRYVPNILTEHIAIDTWESYWQCYLDIKLADKLLPTYYIGLSAYYKGDFEKAIRLMNIPQKGFQTKKLRKMLKDLRENGLLLSHLFLMSTNDDIVSKLPTELNDLLIDNLRLQAIYNILVLKQSDNYFDDIYVPEHRLGELMAIYYRAKNAELKGEYEKTRELFGLLCNENPKLYIVKEAKRYLKVDVKQ